jgi:isopenicillin N synthase-like dioxygenase
LRQVKTDLFKYLSRKPINPGGYEMSGKPYFIPTVNVAPLYSNDPSDFAQVDQVIGDACKNSGAFIASNIPKPVCPDKKQTKKLLAFYDLPHEERKMVGTRRANRDSTHDYRGYSPNMKNGRIRNEIYDIGPDYVVTGPDIPHVGQLIETNQWPAEEPENGWRAEMESYYEHMHDFSKRLMQSMIRYLGADETSGGARFDKSNSTLRLLNYPPLEDGVSLDDDPESIREFNGEKMRIMAIEHKDQCCLTLLWQSDVGGLQMQSPEGEWQAIPPIEEGISVHLGMAMGPMTDHVFEPTPHRVLGKGNARQSIGFFLEPDLHATTQPFTKVEAGSAVANDDTYAASLLRTIAGREAAKKAQQKTG